MRNNYDVNYPDQYSHMRQNAQKKNSDWLRATVV